MIWRSKLIYVHVVLRAPSILWKLGWISRVKDYTGLWRSDVKELHTQSLLTEYITWALNSSSSILVPVSSSYMSISRSRRSFFSLTIPVFISLRRCWITCGRNTWICSGTIYFFLQFYMHVFSHWIHSWWIRCKNYIVSLCKPSDNNFVVRLYIHFNF